MAGFGALDFGLLSSAQLTHMRTSARRVSEPCSIVIFAYLLALVLWCEARGSGRDHRASTAEWALRRDNRVHNVTTDTCLTVATRKTCLPQIHINCVPGVLMGLCSKCLSKSEVIRKQGISMIIVFGLKNAVQIGKQLASSVWRGIHEDPGI